MKLKTGISLSEVAREHADLRKRLARLYDLLGTKIDTEDERHWRRAYIESALRLLAFFDVQPGQVWEGFEDAILALAKGKRRRFPSGRRLRK